MGVRGRKVGTRQQVPTYLIVCEGAKTEPNYFNAFPVTTLDVKVIGTGYNTDSLVKYAVREANMRDYDHVWCVFDRDSFTPQNFNAACQLAASHGFKVAISNECFEIWYLLHFCNFDAAVSRSTYAKRIARHMGERYKKNDPTMYFKLLHKQPDAIRNAERLRASYGYFDPQCNSPCTTVDQLVTELNKHL